MNQCINYLFSCLFGVLSMTSTVPFFHSEDFYLYFCSPLQNLLYRNDLQLNSVSSPRGLCSSREIKAEDKQDSLPSKFRQQ